VKALLRLATIAVFSVGGALADTTIVDILPRSLSNEGNEDSEPNIAVNPGNTSQIAASAFTPDPLNAATAPIFVSIDGGNTWTLNSILPSETVTADVTLKFGTASNVLYAGILKQPIVDRTPELVICRTTDVTKPAVMAVLTHRRGAGVDQPYVSAVTVAGKDEVFIGDNDFNDRAGHTASIDRSTDGAMSPPPAGFDAPIRAESRDTQCGDFHQDGPEIRPAISSNGKTIYAAFNGWRSCSGSSDEIGTVTSDVVVVRDDNGGVGTNPFSALLDPVDHRRGIRVVKARAFNWDKPLLGKTRIGGDLAIAVDPRESKTVYLVWGDFVGNHHRLHLIRSTDAGATWSKDLRMVPDALNPAVAANTAGSVAFLYQQLTRVSNAEWWSTNVELTTDGFATKPRVELLSKFPVAELEPLDPRDQPLLGDYLHMMTVGKDFFGVFCASNKPDRARFSPTAKLVFQRNADFNTHKLLTEDGASSVPLSIDPFFFRITQ
jgi:hypothetical protein